MLRELLNRLNRLRRQLRSLPRALALVARAGGRWTAGWIVLTVIQGLLPVAVVYLTKLIVDAVAASLGAGVRWETAEPILLYGGLMAGVLIVSELLRAAVNWVRDVQSELLRDYISFLIHQKSIDADLAFYESADFYDHLHRARDEAGYRPVALLENLGSLLQNGITLLAMGAVLVPFGLWLPAALLLSTLPAL
ncbi:MAG: hypothetical protein P8Z74_19185 [Acidobacteriota bacterium]